MFKLAIIDDEYIIRNGIANNIGWNNLGFNVIFTANNGKEALNLIAKEVPDVLITDIKMPLMDGIELLKNIKCKYSKIITVILSGYNEFEYAQKAIDYGVYSYILKPIKEEDVNNLFKRIYKSLVYGDNTKKVDVYERLNPIIIRIRDYINEKYYEKITLDELAYEFYINPCYLSKLFKDETGENITTYIQKIRIKKAKTLLMESEYQINEISEKVGYPDYRYFCTTFKKNTGLTPLQFRLKGLL